MIFSKDHIDYIGECHLFSLKRYFFQTKRSALHTKKKSRVFTLSTSDHFVWSAHCHFGVDRLFCSFFLVHFYSSSKCNAKPCGVMHLKSAKMTIFRLEAIFPLILHTVGRQKTAPNRNQKSFFFTKCTHTCWSLLKYSC